MNKLYPVLTLFFSFYAFAAGAQVGPNILWQKTYGGSGDEKAKSMVRTSSGGFVICGFSTSNDGQVTGHHGPTGTNSFQTYDSSRDAWVIDVASDGTLLWQKSYGGTAADELDKIIPTSDGGYIAVGYSYSHNGDVSGNHGGQDVWVVKLDGSGNLQWQKCYGGSAVEYGASIVQTSDGGYMVAGTTNSTDGDVSGLHLQGGYPVADGWLIRLDAAGALLWQQCIGGSYSDQCYEITPMANDEYVLSFGSQGGGGALDGSFAGLSGAQAPTGIVYKIDSAGNKLQAAVAGTMTSCYGAVPISSSQYYFLATKMNCYPQGPNNGLIIGTADSAFKSTSFHAGDNISYCKSSGGISGVGYLATGNGSLCLLSNQTGVVAGQTDDSTHLTLHGQSDGFLANFGPNTWKKGYGGSGIDGFTAVTRVDDYTFAAAGFTNSNNGDVSGNHGGYDFWIVKMSNINVVRGTLFMDYNLNGVKDAGEPVVNNILVQSAKTGLLSGSLTNNGIYNNVVDTGTYTTSVLSALPSYYSVNPLSHTSTFNTYNNTDTINFALQPIPGKTEYKLGISSTLARPGYAVTYVLHYENAGTDTLHNRTVTLVRDNRASYVSSSRTPAATSGDTIRWTVTSLNPRDTGSIAVVLQLATPPTLKIGDTLSFTANIDTTGDLNPQNNYVLLKQPIYSSYDPNEKSEADGGVVYIDDLARGKYLQYTINFQNTGNDTAFNITVLDTLSSKLDITSFEMVGTSHPYQLTVKNGNVLNFSFPGINLQDSSANLPASEGYIVYRIKPVSTVHAGDSIHNTASIYFDFNQPVQTNLQVTYIQNQPFAPPVQPALSGLHVAYCSNAGPAVCTMTNFPDTTAGATVVSDTLDGTPLTIGAGASCTIPLNGLSIGTHVVKVTYTNASGSSSTSQSFVVEAVSTPAVGVSASYTTIPNTAASVTVRANAISGGGNAPIYTFALNPGFAPVVYGPGAADSVIIDTSALVVGTNTVYLRMQTSDSCFTAQLATDSIVITRVAPPPPPTSGDTTGTGSGSDSVNTALGVAPNPFRDQLVVTGLQATESYTISLLNSSGMVVIRSRVSGVTHTTLTSGAVTTGLYLVQVYDETKGYVVRLMRVLALGNH